jgi:hypothetical protein
MSTRYFTLSEARAVLPRVKKLMQMVQEARQEILRLRPEVWPMLRKASLNGGSREAGELLVHFQRLENGVKGIMNMGIIVKDVDQGIIDFLGKRNERDVYLCWQYGEEDIRFWHDLNAGFAGRHPIDTQVS